MTSAAITQADRLASRTVVIVPPATGVVLMIVGASAIRTPSANPPRTPPRQLYELPIAIK